MAEQFSISERVLMKKRLLYLVCLTSPTLLGMCVELKHAADDATVLHYAARNRELSCLKYFLKRGVEVDVRDQDVATQRHWAARWGTPQHLDLLF